VVGRLPMSPPARRESASAAAPSGERRLVLDGMARAVPVFGFEALAAEQAIRGPAIIESATTTVLLRPGDAARMDAQGWLDVTIG
jgi:N-methylhydantoinase A